MEYMLCILQSYQKKIISRLGPGHDTSYCGYTGLCHGFHVHHAELDITHFQYANDTILFLKRLRRRI